MRRTRRVMVVLGIAVLGAASLPAVAAASTPSATPRQATGDGTLRLGADMSTAPTELDLMKVAVVGAQMHNLIYGTLLRMTPSGEVVPDLAESVTVVDPSTIKVVLKDGLVFTDGTPVDAEAYKFSIERMVNEAQPGGKEAEVNQIDTVTVDSPTEFTIRLRQPIAGAITRLMRLCEVGCPTSPTAVQNGTDFSNNPVGAGPYKVVSFTPGQEVTLEKNPDYWDAKNIKVERVQFKHVPGTATVTALSGGEMDLPVQPISLSQGQELAGAPGVKTKTIATDNAMLLGHLCKSRPPFDSLEVRQALNYATDRDDLNEKLFDGRGEPMWGWFASSSPNHDPSLDGYYDYNLKKAKKLLAQADASDLTFDLLFTPASQDSETAAQILQQQWAKAGITANLKPLTQITDFFPNATAGPINVFTLQRAGIPKVSRNLVPGSIGDVCAWDDPELTALVTEAQGLADGSPEQAEVWYKINERTLETAAMLYGLFGTQTLAYNSNAVQKLQTSEGRTGIPEVYIWGTRLKKS